MEEGWMGVGMGGWEVGVGVGGGGGGEDGGTAPRRKFTAPCIKFWGCSSGSWINKGFIRLGMGQNICIKVLEGGEIKSF